MSPVYEFRCPACGCTAGITRPIEDTPDKVTCAYCEADMVRIYSAPAVTFKGDGWAGKK